MYCGACLGCVCVCDRSDLNKAARCPGRKEVSLDSVWHVVDTVQTLKRKQSRAMMPNGSIWILCSSNDLHLRSTYTRTHTVMHANLLAFIYSSTQHLILRQIISPPLGFTVLRAQVTNDRQASSQHLAPPHTTTDPTLLSSKSNHLQKPRAVP